MKSMHIFLIFLLVAIAQIAIPAKMIFDKEDILKTGTVYRFKTEPIDPNDPFRGKYITLRYELDTFKSKDSLWNRGDKVLVYLKKDSLGYASIKYLSKTEQDSKDNYVIANVNWYNKRKHILHFDFEFNRYYMDEFKAKPAEDIYREFNRRGDTINHTYALVSVKNGDAVLLDVLINDISIKDYIEGGNMR